MQPTCTRMRNVFVPTRETIVRSRLFAYFFTFSASSVQTRTVTEKLTVDRPFVFLVHDHKDGLVVAAGKLHVPTKEEEEEDDDDDDDDVNDGQKRGDDAEKVD